MKRTCFHNIPEFSKKNFRIASYAVAAFITISGLFFIYEVLFVGDLTFVAQWNIFKSPLGSICIILGFFCAMLWWGKFTHWSATPIIETRDKYTGELIKREEDHDFMEQGFAKLIMPILGHFVIEPILYGCIIYYPIQCVIALVGSIFPYILTLIVIGIIAAIWLLPSRYEFRYRSLGLLVVGTFFTTAFIWGGIAINNAQPGSTIHMLSEKEQDADTDAVYDNAFGMEEDDQFEGVGEEGLYGSLPDGTTEYVGEMEGFPIEFSIFKDNDVGTLDGVYKSVRYGTTMELAGESLLGDGGLIHFFGKDQNNKEWHFELYGDADNVVGTAYSNDKEYDISLNKK